MGFDLAKFKEPNLEDINLEGTRNNVGTFFVTYLAFRERVGLPREPAITEKYSLAPITDSDVDQGMKNQMLENEELKKEFFELHELFVLGYTSIEHPFKPAATERRKKIFYDRYINGHSAFTISERNQVGKDVVTCESKKAIVQFAEALEITDYKKRRE